LSFLCSFAGLGNYGSGDSSWLSRRGRVSGWRGGSMSLRRGCCCIMRGRHTGAPRWCGLACRKRSGRLIGNTLLLAGRRSDWLGNRRLDHNRARWRNDDDGRFGDDHRACGGLGDDCACWRPRGNGRRSRGRDNDGRRGTRLGHNFARLRTGWRGCGRNRRLGRRCRTCRGCNRLRLGAHGRMALPRLKLFLLFVG
jgi:hypothetical protein